MTTYLIRRHSTSGCYDGQTQTDSLHIQKLILVPASHLVPCHYCYPSLQHIFVSVLQIWNWIFFSNILLIMLFFQMLLVTSNEAHLSDVTDYIHNVLMVEIKDMLDDWEKFTKTVNIWTPCLAFRQWWFTINYHVLSKHESGFILDSVKWNL